MNEPRYGRYTVVDKIGQGGMSVVYRAIDPSLDRAVALKVMHPHLADRPESRARFAREARAVARLRHPHIVEVYDFAPADSEQAYIVSELIEGPTLRAFAEDHALALPEAAALLMLPIVEALAKAHEAGIVHRDVKPENIMIRPDGSPVLMDFGIAQMVDTETLTATGTVLGSPAHMAPEVIDGHEVGAPADVFAVGTVLYWLVCGALPFAGPNPSALFRRILEGRFDPVLRRRPHAGRAMARLIERCLATDTAERPSAAELADALGERLADAGITDLRNERRDFVGDPAVYQDELGRRLLPRLVTRARSALDQRKTARALDLLDRALALDEHHPEAQALVERIERGQKLGHRLRIAAAALLLLGLGGAGWWLAADGATGDLSGGDGQDPTAAGQLPLDAPTARALDAGAATASPGADATLASALDGTPDAASDALSSTPDAAPDVAPDAVVDAGRITARPIRPRTRRRRPRPVIRPPEPEPTPPPPTSTARVAIHGQYKGARVFVDGRPEGYLYVIERKGGLDLPPGRHEIRFQNPGCADQRHIVEIAEGQTRAPPVAFACQHRPATLRVEGPEILEVRRTADGRPLGRTNQDIRVPVEQLKSRISLTIGPLGDSVERTVTLTAGERQVLRLAGRPDP